MTVDRAGVEWNGRTFGRLEDWEKRDVSRWVGEEAQRELARSPGKRETEYVTAVISKPVDKFARGDRVRYVGPPDPGVPYGTEGEVLREAVEYTRSRMLLVRVVWEEPAPVDARMDLRPPVDLEQVEP